MQGCGCSVIVDRMPHLSKLIAVTLLWAAAAAVSAAPPLTEALQAELDRAVIDYESGRLDAAGAAFDSLSRRGVPAAQYNLAVMHLRAELPQPDPARALALLTQAAEGGFVTAQFMLGQGWENGQFGRSDLAAALVWYEIAAIAGSADAQVAMGTAYYLGRGVARKPAEAARWYREAANAGDVGAQYLLASMYEQGDGVALDVRLARYWYDIAARNGDAAAPGKVRELDARRAAPSS